MIGYYFQFYPSETPTLITHHFTIPPCIVSTFHLYLYESVSLAHSQKKDINFLSSFWNDAVFFTDESINFKLSSSFFSQKI